MDQSPWRVIERSNTEVSLSSSKPTRLKNDPTKGTEQISSDWFIAHRTAQSWITSTCRIGKTSASPTLTSRWLLIESLQPCTGDASRYQNLDKVSGECRSMKECPESRAGYRRRREATKAVGCLFRPRSCIRCSSTWLIPSKMKQPP